MPVVESSLVTFWRKASFNQAPYVHPDDVASFCQAGVSADKVIDFQSYITGKDWQSDEGKLHLSLLPAPYVGDLQNADIVILLLNPGFSVSDYFWEGIGERFRESVLFNIRQENLDVDFPNLCLNPKYAATGGFGWWERKLRSITMEIKKASGGTYFEALSQVSKRVAAVELFPYHSSSFSQQIKLDRFASVKAARRYVHNALIPKAKRGEITIIVSRAIKGWQLDNTDSCDDVVFYSGGEARAASLGLESKGGKAILRRLGLGDNARSLF